MSHLQQPHHIQTQQPGQQPQRMVPAPLPQQAAPLQSRLVNDGDVDALDRQKVLRHSNNAYYCSNMLHNANTRMAAVS